MVPFIIAGLTTGSIFALAATGLVLTYKTSGIFNLAHGALASASAFLFYFLHQQRGMPWPLAAVICIGIGGPVVGLLLELVARRLQGATLAAKVLATAGVMLVILGAVQLLYPSGQNYEVQSFLPAYVFTLWGARIEVSQIIIFVIGAAAALALTLFLRYARYGLSMRAVVDDPELLDVAGISPTKVRRLAWAIGSSMAAASGVLLAPLLPLDATGLTFLVVTAFGAVAVGAFTSLPLTYLGALAIGVGQALLEKYFVTSTGLAAGLAPSLPFLILFVLLLAAPRLRRPSGDGFLKPRPRSSWQAPWQFKAGGGAAVLAVLVAVPQFAGINLDSWTIFLSYVVLFLSLGLLVRLSGQVSLAHVSFMAIGVVAFSHLAVDHHWPWLVALAGAALIAAPVGALLAIPAIRFPGLYLALATLGFGLVLEQMFYSQPYMFGTSYPLTVPRPFVSWADLGSDTGYYYVVLAFVMAVTILVVFIARSRLGRLLSAMSDSATGLAASGASIRISLVLVFCVSASLAAVAGVLGGATLSLAAGASYMPFLSVQLFAVAMISPGAAPWYALLAAAGQSLVPAYFSQGATITNLFTLLFGFAAIGYAIDPWSARQAPAPLRRLLDRLNSGEKPAAHGPAPAQPLVVPAQPPVPVPNHSRSVRPSATGLRVEDVTVRFGGLVANDGISLEVPVGRITGLIGPNGAGKSTLFNVCSGLVSPSSGTVWMDGRRLDHLGAPARARHGLGRTFQQTELFESLTVRQNIAMGCEAAWAGRNPLDHIVTGIGQRRMIRERTDESIRLCGLAELADAHVASLSTGWRRHVELARCVAGTYEVLLLDEPSSGLDRRETQHLGEILGRVVRERGVGILLVEHDMALVNQVCDHVYVIDFGKQIFDGATQEIKDSEIVRRAYLGEDIGVVEGSNRRPSSSGTTRTSVRTRSAGPMVARDPGSDAAPLLEFAGVTAGYGSTTVLRDVSIHVQAGEVVALLGPNGAGKTTALRCASGSVRPSRGRILVDGRDITKAPPYRRAEMGLCLIPEGRGIFRSLTVAENLRLSVPSYSSNPSEALDRALTSFPVLGSRLNEIAGHLSGGQQQMLSVARAYLGDAKVIMLDEVSLGLAPLVVDEIYQALDALAKTGVAMLLVEQYVSRALHMCDSVVLLNKGGVAYSGPPTNLDEQSFLRDYLGVDYEETSGS
jgi:ABC-type branched-subunit amino acid transport system ATPase component/branched-subunit amino acid ABC-type transport system permease component